MTDWDTYKKHREAVVREEGQYLGLLDHDGNLLCHLPPCIELQAPQARNAVTNLEATFPLHGDNPEVLHPITEHLVAHDLGRLTPDGRFQPVIDHARLVIVERAGARRAYKVTHVKVEGIGDRPSQMTIYGASLIDFALGGIPCASFPGSWKPNTFRSFERDEGAVYDTPREMAPIELAAIADGFSVHGPAEATLRRLIERSLQAAYDVTGHPRGIVVDQHSTGLPSPEVYIRPSDGYILDEIADIATMAGVHLYAHLWLPGDPQPAGHTLDTPTCVVKVRQVATP